jgi:hypothetical protein
MILTQSASVSLRGSHAPDRPFNPRMQGIVRDFIGFDLVRAISYKGISRSGRRAMLWPTICQLWRTSCTRFAIEYVSAYAYFRLVAEPHGDRPETTVICQRQYQVAQLRVISPSLYEALWNLTRCIALPAVNSRLIMDRSQRNHR